jgi:hypothetical protein
LVQEALPGYGDGLVREPGQEIEFDEYDEELEELYSDEYDDELENEFAEEEVDEDNRGNVISPDERVARAHVDS